MPGFQKLSADSAVTFWDELVEKNNVHPTIAHNPHLFSFFSGFLSLSPFYFILTEKELAVGLFPVVKTGNHFISMPHLSYGGILWLNKTEEKPISEEEKVIQGIVAEIEKENLEAGFYTAEMASLKKPETIKNIEIRSEVPYFETVVSAKTRHFIYLKKSLEEQLKCFSSNLRRKISKAEKNGIVVKRGKVELLKDFVAVYQKNMHRLGSPALGSDFFKSLLDLSEANAEIFLAYNDLKPIGAAFCMYYGGFYENVWFSTLSNYNQQYTSYTLHWNMIQRAISENKRIYSLGRSTTGSGVHEFKKQWEAEESPIYFSKTIQPKFSLKDQKWLTSIWKLLPAAFVNYIGPSVAKTIY